MVQIVQFKMTFCGSEIGWTYLLWDGTGKVKCFECKSAPCSNLFVYLRRYYANIAPIDSVIRLETVRVNYGGYGYPPEHWQRRKLYIATLVNMQKVLERKVAQAGAYPSLNQKTST